MDMPSTAFSMSEAPVSVAAAKSSVKSTAAYRTISEAAEQLAVPQHVLRFWETKFPQIRPMKRSGGRRYYRPQDLATLQTIQNLLYDQGYTIKGVQRLLKARRAPAELADMTGMSLAIAEPDALSLDLDALVGEVSDTAAALDTYSAPSMLAQAMHDVLAAIPAHLPAGPAALMAAGLEAGRPVPVIDDVAPHEILLANALTAGDAESVGLPIEQRLRLECLLEELLALKAELL